MTALWKQGENILFSEVRQIGRVDPFNRDKRVRKARPAWPARIFF
jgi:hypothetical protein